MPQTLGYLIMLSTRDSLVSQLHNVKNFFLLSRQSNRCQSVTGAGRDSLRCKLKLECIPAGQQAARFQWVINKDIITYETRFVKNHQVVKALRWTINEWRLRNAKEITRKHTREWLLSECSTEVLIFGKLHKPASILLTNLHLLRNVDLKIIKPTRRIAVKLIRITDMMRTASSKPMRCCRISQMR